MSEFKVGDIVVFTRTSYVFKVIGFLCEHLLSLPNSRYHENYCRHATTEEKKEYYEQEKAKIEKELEALEEPKLWMVEKNESYYYVDEYNCVQKRIYTSGKLRIHIDILYNNGNLFQTREEAEQEARLRSFEQRVARRFKELGGGKFVVGGDNFTIKINLDKYKVTWMSWFEIYGSQRGWYHNDTKIVKQIIEEFGEGNFIKWAKGEL